MSYQMQLSDRSRRAARFIRKVHREIQKAFEAASEKGMTQQALATKLEINRATVNKRLLGQDNLTLRSIADLAWALDNDVDLTFVPRVASQGNHRENDGLLMGANPEQRAVLKPLSRKGNITQAQADAAVRKTRRQTQLSSDQA